jgi:hypothetical protein
MALTPEGIEAFDTNVPAKPKDWPGEWPPQCYVVFRAPTFKRESLALSRASLDVNDYFSVMAVGRDAGQVRWVQERMQDVLDRAHPVVEGFAARSFLRTTGAVDVDRSIAPDLAHATDLYRYRATPA